MIMYYNMVLIKKPYIQSIKNTLKLNYAMENSIKVEF